MSDPQVDLDDWLKSKDPLDHAAVDVTLDENDRMLAMIRRRLSTGHRHRRLAVAIAAIAVTACAAAAYVATRPPNDPTTVGCYASLAPDANVAIVPMGPDPLATCRAAWNDPTFDEVFLGQNVPALGACISKNGSAAVYPVDHGDPCSQLGLDRLGKPNSNAAAIEAFETAVSERLIARCVPLTEAEQIVDDERTKAGLGDWTVISPPGPNPGDCGSIAVDPPNRTIEIVPIPPPN